MKSDKLVFLSKPAIVSALGDDTKKNMEKILQGSSALIKNSTMLNKDIYIGKITSHLPEIKNPKFNTRTNSILLLAIKQIEEEIKNAIKKYGKDRIAVVIGNTTTGIEENLEFFKEHEKKGLWEKELYEHDKQSLANPSDFIKDFFNLESFSFAISTACTSGAKALIYAKNLIQNDFCDAVICGGVDSINTLTMKGFDALGLISSNISNPFSENRNGINIGEGAALFLACKDEISPIYIAGEAANQDAFHITKPDENAKNPIIAINKALEKAGLKSVDYINLHATGTGANDKMEARAFNNTLPNVSASSTKPLMGHTLGAAGAIEAGICFELINKCKTKLPIHKFDGNYDSDLENINLVLDDEIKEINSALSSSFAFGGDNAILILRRKID